MSDDEKQDGWGSKSKGPSGAGAALIAVVIVGLALGLVWLLWVTGFFHLF